VRQWCAQTAESIYFNASSLPAPRRRIGGVREFSIPIREQEGKGETKRGRNGRCCRVTCVRRVAFYLPRRTNSRIHIRLPVSLARSLAHSLSCSSLVSLSLAPPAASSETSRREGGRERETCRRAQPTSERQYRVSSHCYPGCYPVVLLIRACVVRTCVRACVRRARVCVCACAVRNAPLIAEAAAASSRSRRCSLGSPSRRAATQRANGPRIPAVAVSSSQCARRPRRVTVAK